VSALPEHDPLAAIGEALDNPAPAPILAEQGDRVAGDGEDDDFRPFPLDCPISPLGMSSGLDGTQRCYYLNVLGKSSALRRGTSTGKITSLRSLATNRAFSNTNGRCGRSRCASRSAASGSSRSNRRSSVSTRREPRALIEECSRRGIFEPAGRLRGRGAHRLTGGGLVLHYGDEIATLRPRANGDLRPLEWHAAGLHDRMVYPAAMPLPRPWPRSVPPVAAIRVAELLRTWNWKRPALDPVLLLGAIGQGYIGGALPWRSNVWITGGRGTGKSALNGRPDEGQGIIPQLYGEALFRTGNTSAAAIRQSLKIPRFR
jgi:hypothetical protein